MTDNEVETRRNVVIAAYSYVRCRYLPVWVENNQDKTIRVVYAAPWTKIESGSISRIKSQNFSFLSSLLGFTVLKCSWLSSVGISRGVLKTEY